MKNLILFIAFGFSFFSCGKDFEEKQNNSYYIFGQLKNSSDDTKVYLKVQESNKIITLDTTDVISNTFQFKGYTNKPGYAEKEDKLRQEREAKLEELASLRQIDNFHIQEGLIVGNKKTLRQKQVDIMIAVQMLQHTIRKNMQKFTLFYFVNFLFSKIFYNISCALSKNLS